MDPASIVGFASSIVQLVSFIGSLVSKNREIRSSATGALDENVELEAITSSLQQLTRDVRGQKRDLEHHSRPHLDPGGPKKRPKNERERTEAKQNKVYVKRKKELDEMCEGCNLVANNLLHVVKELKGKAPDGLWASFRQALLTVWKEKEIQDLSHRLERYRQQIDTLLLVSLSERIHHHDSAPNNTAELDFFAIPPDSWKSAVINEVQRQNWQAKNEQDVAMFSTCLSESLELDREQHNQLRILENLRFSDMSDRYERISDAHKKTFEWIFSQPRQDGQPSVQAQPRNGSKLHKYRQGDFLNWLSSDEKLFWITGKPGSGKSTLMKYLHDEPQLLSHLVSWQGEKELFKTGFFFWNSGTVMQMSKMGLLRKMLYDALQHAPCQIPSHFPDRWNFTKLFGSDPRPWSWVELVEAFGIVLSDVSKKTFLFIDGLDEFDGDYADLPSWLFSMTSSRPNVKVCVASRPWTVFEDAFGSQPSLRVEDLTEHDIRLFTLETLHSRSNGRFHQLEKVRPDCAQYLISEVTEKAAGVFLWVQLVVMSLLEGLQDGDSIADLQARTQSLPPDLEKLFKKIMDDLKPSYRKEASRMIRMVQTAMQISERPITLLAFSFLDDDINKAISAEVKPLDPEDLEFRLDMMRRRLSSRSKGLLEASRFHRDGPETKVEFLHRTVRDFVAREDIREYFHAEEEDFDAHRTLCVCETLYLKCFDSNRSHMNHAFTESITLAARCSQQLQSAGDSLKTAVVYELHKTAKTLFPVAQTIASRRGSPEEQKTRELRNTQPWILRLDPSARGHTESLLEWAIFQGLVSFVRHEARQHQLITNSDYNPLSPAVAAFLTDRSRMEHFHMAEILFEHGADPNYTGSMPPSPWSLLTTNLKNSELSDNELNMIKLFCKNNAKPQIYTEGMSHDDIRRQLKGEYLFTASTPKPQKRRFFGRIRILGSISRASR